MRFSRRFKVRLSILTALGLIATLALSAVPSAFAQAGPQAASVSHAGARLTISRIASGRNVPSQSAASVGAASNNAIVAPFHTPARNGAKSARLGVGAPLVTGSTLSGNIAEGSLLHNFNALSDLDQAAVNPPQHFQVTPPDQGLCAGNVGFHAGGATVLWELVNDAAVVLAPNGTQLTPVISLATLFSDPGASGDIRCFYDTATNTFFFSEIGALQSGPDKGQTATDLAVLNANGYAAYQIDTSDAGKCFGDQPHVGFDAHALYISTDEFCGPLQNNFIGAILFGLSKSQLVAEAPSVNAVEFGPLSLGGDPILTLEPAFGFPSATEYLLNSFPFDQFGNNNSIANTLGFWTVTGDQHITSGSGTVTLTGKIISSETYAFPMPAASTGDGSIKCVPGNHEGIPPCTHPPLEPVESEPFLNPDDSRLLQVQLVNDKEQGLRLYAALDSAVTIKGDPSARDGAAWFVLNPRTGSVTRQGFVAVAGAYLLYPAILHTREGTTALAFTITSPTINPSTAFAVEKSGSHSFGSVRISGAGTGPHLSFAGPVFHSPRWGDYSAEELDPNGVDIWSASEYIPAPADQASRDNWGTEIWDVAGDR